MDNRAERAGSAQFCFAGSERLSTPFEQTFPKLELAGFVSPLFSPVGNVIGTVAVKMKQSGLAFSEEFISLGVIDVLCPFELIESPYPQFEVLMPRKLIRHGAAAVVRFPFTSLVTDYPFRDFIPMNVQAKDASTLDFPLLSSSGPLSSVLDGEIARRCAGTSDASASYQ